MIFNMVTIGSGGGPVLPEFPEFTYTGESLLLDDGLDENGNQNWRLKLLTSGKLTMGARTWIDAFLVAGGGAGSLDWDSGGGGGYVMTKKELTLVNGTAYDVTIGEGGIASKNVFQGTGKPTTAFGFTVEGGKPGTGAQNGTGGDGASGGGSTPDGNGGADGGNGSGPHGGIGQGTTTREFGEPNGELYAGGGGARANGKGGAGGGGDYKKDGQRNTGGGGSGYANGGSGVVVIRNVRTTETVASLSARVTALEENAVNRI